MGSITELTDIQRSALTELRASIPDAVVWPVHIDDTQLPDVPAVGATSAAILAAGVIDASGRQYARLSIRTRRTIGSTRIWYKIASYDAATTYSVADGTSTATTTGTTDAEGTAEALATSADGQSGMSGQAVEIDGDWWCVIDTTNGAGNPDITASVSGGTGTDYCLVEAHEASVEVYEVPQVDAAPESSAIVARADTDIGDIGEWIGTDLASHRTWGHLDRPDGTASVFVAGPGSAYQKPNRAVRMSIEDSQLLHAVTTLTTKPGHSGVDASIAYVAILLGPSITSGVAE